MFIHKENEDWVFVKRISNETTIRCSVCIICFENQNFICNTIVNKDGKINELQIIDARLLN